MGCLDAKYTRIGGGIGSSFNRVGDFFAWFAMAYPGQASISLVPSCFAAAFSRNGGDLQCSFSLVCETNIRAPYLEIEPTIVWVLDGWASNDVYSNTRWNVD